MTREEAVEIYKRYWGREELNSHYLAVKQIDFLAALGIIKLDDKKRDPVADFVVEMQAEHNTTLAIHDVEAALKAVGLKIVEA